ncbi:hypothetical protein KL86DES1_20677 [uncultured Desulfovibrio sp.]|uniref:Uncharacterized protein n=1 Tax=uncultured Desulfovibrio sp. TaxID=167968 RepID=A0A212L4X6_9BACT|nr:hypothetical protein KL86DES1_20677 [uncultured Desulfovibrio sp.]VZH33579.1 conserved protein of unknown function [Desulfovibrio sp. 86]
MSQLPCKDFSENPWHEMRVSRQKPAHAHFKCEQCNFCIALTAA